MEKVWNPNISSSKHLLQKRGNVWKDVGRLPGSGITKVLPYYLLLVISKVVGSSNYQDVGITKVLPCYQEDYQVP